MDRLGDALRFTGKNWYVLSGYDYQLKVTAEVYDSTGRLRETQVEYSDSVYY